MLDDPFHGNLVSADVVGFRNGLYHIITRYCAAVASERRKRLDCDIVGNGVSYCLIIMVQHVVSDLINRRNHFGRLQKRLQVTFVEITDTDSFDGTLLLILLEYFPSLTAVPLREVNQHE